VGGPPQLAQGLRADAALRGDAPERSAAELARQEKPLRLVAADAVPRGVLGVELVDRRPEEVEPQLVALEGERAAPGDDDPVGRLRGLAEDQEDPLEGAAVGGRAVEEQRDPGAGLPERPRRRR